MSLEDLWRRPLVLLAYLYLKLLNITGRKN
jgi:hypothetical protein